MTMSRRGRDERVGCAVQPTRMTKRRRRGDILRIALLVLGMTGGASAQETALIEDYVRAAVSAPPASLGVDPFYKKYTDALGIPILSSEKVPDAALLVARDIVIAMLAKRPDLRQEMIKKKMRVGVMAHSEVTTDIPEHRDRKKPSRDDPRLTPAERANYDRPGGIGSMTDKQYWDRRARGLGGNPTTCAEENLLGYPGTRYYGENILIHEFAHAIMGVAIRTADPRLYEEIQAAYREAMAKGLWKGHYAATNANEYWAEGTQTWFWSNYEYRDGSTRVQTPDDLQRYDPKLYELLSRVYETHRIPMDVYHGRNIAPPRRQQPEGIIPQRGNVPAFFRPYGHSDPGSTDRFLDGKAVAHPVMCPACR